MYTNEHGKNLYKLWRVTMSSSKKSSNYLLDSLKEDKIKKETAKAQEQSQNPKSSLLIPKSLQNFADEALVKVQYKISEAMNEQLKLILSDVSPFISPFSIPQLINLIYCESFHNPQIISKIRSEFKTCIKHIDNSGLSIIDQKIPLLRSTILISPKILRHLAKDFECPEMAKASIVLTWIVLNYDWLKENMTWKGLPKPPFSVKIPKTPYD